MGFLGLTYRRPPSQPIGRPTDEENNESLAQQSVASIHSDTSIGIPDALQFDRIMDGGTCPPCTVRDFLNYLIYIEHSAENLQFLLWHRSYVRRFHSADTPDLALAPEWTEEEQDETFAKLQKEYRDGLRRDPASVAAVLKGTDFEKDSNTFATGNPRFLDSRTPVFFEMGNSNPFSTPPGTPSLNDRGSSSEYGTAGSPAAASWRRQANEAFAAVGIKAPFTIQPFREEIDRVIATYIMDNAPRQLNLSARERQQLLIALSQTTHPTAFRQVERSVESTLRMQAHPNFIRWSICNGNPARVFFANFLGAFLIVGSLVAYILLCLSSVPRGYRAIPAVGMVLGVSTQCAALKGMCVVLHGMHHRHVRPWEMFVDEEVELREDGSDEKGSGPHGASSSTFSSSNSYEDQPWVVKYEKRNLIRKVFDREVWIQEPALRSIQDTIFVQAMLVAAVSTAILTAIFVCVPGGNFY
ncbi:hypothetical protein M406DRAFT_292381 [Cryphonectria parasitica EP155]|uniref:RGS domain-containing protein n=1 Tax=Cryphonectria parasitica (strain ATCC 38755 / EP155) TaxID=660469 RepID=A0A9P5CPF1_CRYP1|nr:uncharacterized protein M406DRAFT_292381 [Cryphonectria parasitica EP155]KAF3765096.1 hypothetical protein M406DRAFT_292381 [Cryphonectria parasitica EP155]